MGAWGVGSGCGGVVVDMVDLGEWGMGGVKGEFWGGDLVCGDWCYGC